MKIDFENPNFDAVCGEFTYTITVKELKEFDETRKDFHTFNALWCLMGSAIIPLSLMGIKRERHGWNPPLCLNTQIMRHILDREEHKRYLAIKRAKEGR